MAVGETVGSAGHMRPICVCVCVCTRVRVCIRVSRGEAPGDTKDPGPATGWTVCPKPVTAETTMCMCLHAHVCLSEGSVTVTGVGLQPQGFICPGASSWGNWDPGARYWRDSLSV